MWGIEVRSCQSERGFSLGTSRSLSEEEESEASSTLYKINDLNWCFYERLERQRAHALLYIKVHKLDILSTWPCTRY